MKIVLNLFRMIDMQFDDGVDLKHVSLKVLLLKETRKLFCFLTGYQKKIIIISASWFS